MCAPAMLTSLTGQSSGVTGAASTSLSDALGQIRTTACQAMRSGRCSGQCQRKSGAASMPTEDACLPHQHSQQPQVHRSTVRRQTPTHGLPINKLGVVSTKIWDVEAILMIAAQVWVTGNLAGLRKRKLGVVKQRKSDVEKAQDQRCRQRGRGSHLIAAKTSLPGARHGHIQSGSGVVETFKRLAKELPRNLMIALLVTRTGRLAGLSRSGSGVASHTIGAALTF